MTTFEWDIIYLLYSTATKRVARAVGQFDASTYENKHFTVSIFATQAAVVSIIICV